MPADLSTAVHLGDAAADLAGGGFSKMAFWQRNAFAVASSLAGANSGGFDRGDL